ncbi:unnamed protein product, partial [Rotaria magnacalcarata]
MSNAIFPKTIQLAIYGCGQPGSLVTKAQIESVATTTTNVPITTAGVVSTAITTANAPATTPEVV